MLNDTPTLINERHSGSCGKHELPTIWGVVIPFGLDGGVPSRVEWSCRTSRHSDFTFVLSQLIWSDFSYKETEVFKLKRSSTKDTSGALSTDS